MVGLAFAWQAWGFGQFAAYLARHGRGTLSPRTVQHCLCRAGLGTQWERLAVRGARTATTSCSPRESAGRFAGPEVVASTWVRSSRANL